jgi:hypothetical protein
MMAIFYWPASWLIGRKSQSRGYRNFRTSNKGRNIQSGPDYRRRGTDSRNQRKNRLHKWYSPNDASYASHSDYRILPSDYSSRDFYGPTKVPAGSVFILVDNRDVGEDSRQFGPVS